MEPEIRQLYFFFNNLSRPPPTLLQLMFYTGFHIKSFLSHILLTLKLIITERCSFEFSFFTFKILRFFIFQIYLFKMFVIPNKNHSEFFHIRILAIPNYLRKNFRHSKFFTSEFKQFRIFSFGILALPDILASEFCSFRTLSIRTFPILKKGPRSKSCYNSNKNTVIKNTQIKQSITKLRNSLELTLYYQ